MRRVGSAVHFYNQANNEILQRVTFSLREMLKFTLIEKRNPFEIKRITVTILLHTHNRILTQFRLNFQFHSSPSLFSSFSLSLFTISIVSNGSHRRIIEKWKILSSSPPPPLSLPFLPNPCEHLFRAPITVPTIIQRSNNTDRNRRYGRPFLRLSQRGQQTAAIARSLAMGRRLCVPTR